MASLRTLIAELESTEFDTGDVQILGLRGHERISELFWFELEVVMRNGAELPEDATPGAAVTIVLRDDGASPPTVRCINGMLESIEDALDGHRKHRTYVLRVVPELARLELVETQEIYCGLSVPEIIDQKLDLHGLAGAHLKNHAEGYPKREFVVQYRESDLAFVRRLAEHLGISFVFEHGDDGSARVIFTDDVLNAGIGDLVKEVAFRADGEHVDVFALSSKRRMLPTTYVAQDYNYRHPMAEITGTHQLERGGELFGDGGGIVEYGTHHKSKLEGDKIARVRAEERESSAEVYSGQSAVLTLTAGAAPVLTGHPLLGDVRLLIVEIEHTAKFGGEATESGADSYRNTFKAIPAGVHYRPPRVTPRPRMHGLLTGTVSLGPHGSFGGRAQIDDEGRYVVQLHFDTVTHEGEDKASHAIRMVQPFAGPNHGMHFPLRPGAEVVIAFLDGDPDRPIIVGSVPNALSRSTTTAANAHQNRIQSATGIIVQFSDNK